MVSAIGSSTDFSAASGSTPAGLEAQLARQQQQLAEWECCPSAKTQGGKQKIQEISSRISNIKARISTIENSKVRQTQKLVAADSGAATNKVDNFKPEKSTSSTIGRIVDVLA